MVRGRSRSEVTETEAPGVAAGRPSPWPLNHSPMLPVIRCSSGLAGRLWEWATFSDAYRAGAALPQTWPVIPLVPGRNTSPCRPYRVGGYSSERAGLAPRLHCWTCVPVSGSDVLLRGQDLNLRPLGYEPDELPDCSTPRCKYKQKGRHAATPSDPSLRQQLTGHPAARVRNGRRLSDAHHGRRDQSRNERVRPFHHDDIGMDPD